MPAVFQEYIVFCHGYVTSSSGQKTRTAQIVVGAHGAISICFNHLLGFVKIDASMETIQKSAVLGTAHILGKVLAE